MIRAEEFTLSSAASLQPLYLIYGEETLLALEAADSLRRTAKEQGFTEREVLTVETGFNWSSLLHAQQSLSLFSEKKLIELRIPSGKPGTEGSQALIEYAAQLPSHLIDTLVLIILPKLDKATLNSKWFTALKDKGQCVHAQAIERNRLPHWIQTRLQSQQQSLTPEALVFLCDRVEGNLLAAHQEIQKFALLYPPGELTLKTLEADLNDMARYDVFKLSEAILQDNPQRYLRMIRGLLSEGEAPTLILWTLTEEIRTLLKVGQARARGANLSDIYRTHRIWGEKTKWIESALTHLTAQQLKQALLEAANIDAMIKGLNPANIEDALVSLGLSLMSKTTQRFVRGQS